MTVPNHSSGFSSWPILDDEVHEMNHSEQHVAASSTSGISTPQTLIVELEQGGPTNLEIEAVVNGETLKSGLALQSEPT
jgi:hypothetical protein